MADARYDRKGPVEQDGACSAIALVTQLFRDLEAASIPHCHWKSNIGLERALNGEGDLDLLVYRLDRGRFEAVLARCGFRQVSRPGLASDAPVVHFYGYDASADRWIHVHAYFAVHTGGSLVKTVHLPLERLLLEHVRIAHGVRVPTAAAEFLVFVLRKSVENGFVCEWPLARREATAVERELAWLASDEDTVLQADELRARWLPAVDSMTFSRAVAALQSGSTVTRSIVGRRVRSQLRGAQIQSRGRRIGAQLRALVRRGLSRAFRRPYRARILGGGLVIAFVGPEASGKSTLVGAVSQWLAGICRVETDHAGRPKPSLWLRPVWAVGRLVRPTRLWFHPHRSSPSGIPGHPIRRPGSIPPGARGLLYVVRAMAVALARARVVRRARRLALSGAIVLVDRYPHTQTGRPDGPRLDPLSIESGWMQAIACLENRVYRLMPPPDLVMQLRVPLALAVLRNAQRSKKQPESESYVRWRHGLIPTAAKPSAHVCEIDVGGDLETTVRAVQRAIWTHL